MFPLHTSNAVSSVQLISNLRQFALGSGLCSRTTAQRGRHTRGGAARQPGRSACGGAGGGGRELWTGHTPAASSRRLGLHRLQLLGSAHFSVVFARGHPWVARAEREDGTEGENSVKVGHCFRPTLCTDLNQNFKAGSDTPFTFHTTHLSLSALLATSPLPQNCSNSHSHANPFPDAEESPGPQPPPCCSLLQ